MPMLFGSSSRQVDNKNHHQFPQQKFQYISFVFTHIQLNYQFQ